MANKKILVTGSAGFIGFHASLALQARGDFVIGCDHFNSYYDVQLKKKRAQVLQDRGIETVAIDICQTDALEALLQQHRISHLLHLAAQAGVRYSLVNPEAYVHSNLNGFVQILELLKRHPHIKLTYASSSSVYGLNSKIPFSESDPTDHPASFYGTTKKCNELMAHAYHHLFHIACTGLRFFTVYGPWGRPDMAYFSFTKAILEGKPIQVYHEGKLYRDFTYIDDIIQGILSAIDLEAPFELFNLGNNQPESVIDLIHILEEALDRKANIEFQPLPPGDILTTYADISKSQRLLHFQPTTHLREGLQHFINWYTQTT